jgi:hypothetical protein
MQHILDHGRLVTPALDFGKQALDQMRKNVPGLGEASVNES